MKKILSILCALALCFSLTTLAFAEEGDQIEETTVAGAITEDDVDAAVQEAKEIADQIVEELKKVMSDAGAVSLKDYLEDILAKIKEATGYDIDASEIYAALEEKGIDVDEFLVLDAENIDALIDAIFDEVDANGGDVNALYEFLKDSKIANWFASIYVQEPEETTTEETTTDIPTDPDPVPTDIDVPTTGDHSAVAGVAVLAVAAAAAVVCTKKAKKDAE